MPFGTIRFQVGSSDPNWLTYHVYKYTTTTKGCQLKLVTLPGFEPGTEI